MPAKPKPTVADAQLILELYELRREPEMRKARDWCTQEFIPSSCDDVLKLAFALGLIERRGSVLILPAPRRKQISRPEP